jgi:hypothetical protein
VTVMAGVLQRRAAGAQLASGRDLVRSKGIKHAWGLQNERRLPTL